MRVESNLLLLKGVFRCLNCGNKTTVEQSSEYMKAPIECPNCGGIKFELVIEESEFKNLDESVESKVLQQQIELSEMWDRYFFSELIQKAMLEIESRTPLRKLSKEEVELEKAQGMRRGSS